MRRLFALATTAALLAAACGPMETRDADPATSAHPDFPDGYQGWKKIHDEAIVQADDDIAWETYAKATPDLGEGTVLVKEQYRLVGGDKGELEFIGVMKRTGSAGATNGWEFLAFDPVTKQPSDDATACVGCHTLQAGNDYLFTPRQELLP